MSNKQLGTKTVKLVCYCILLKVSLLEYNLQKSISIRIQSPEKY